MVALAVVVCGLTATLTAAPAGARTDGVTAADATVPGAPTGIIAGNPGDGQAAVGWSAPQSNGGSPITSWVITPYIGDVAQTPFPSTTKDNSQLVTGLTNGQYHTFKVAAVNAVGVGPQSVASPAVLPAGKPGVPTNVTAVAGDKVATVSWTAPAPAGGVPVLGYLVTPYKNGVAQPQWLSSGAGTSKEVTGLTNGTSYTFTVAAKNFLWTGTASAPSNAVTPKVMAPKPSAPTSVAAVAGNGQATVTWKAPATGSPITGYTVIPMINGFEQVPRSSPGTGTSLVVSGLTNGTSYTFKVTATNASGTGVASSPSAAVIPGEVPAWAPFTSWSALVKRMYVDLTTKQPTSTELNAWITRLSGGTSVGEFADELRRGPENLANVDPVVRVYRAFLGRAPDAGGLKFWINRKRSVAPAKTWSVTQIATEFTKSNEFKTKYGSLTNRQFVTQIYTDVLGRPADPSGVTYWTGKLDRKERTKAQVVVGFSESNEYKTKQLQNTDVAVAFTYLLGRAPTSAEATAWVTRQKAGTNHFVLLEELLDSAAYAARIAG